MSLAKAREIIAREFYSQRLGGVATATIRASVLCSDGRSLKRILRAFDGNLLEYNYGNEGPLAKDSYWRLRDPLWATHIKPDLAGKIAREEYGDVNQPPGAVVLGVSLEHLSVDELAWVYLNSDASRITVNRQDGRGGIRVFDAAYITEVTRRRRLRTAQKKAKYNTKEILEGYMGIDTDLVFIRPANRKNAEQVALGDDIAGWAETAREEASRMRREALQLLTTAAKVEDLSLLLREKSTDVVLDQIYDYAFAETVRKDAP